MLFARVEAAFDRDVAADGVQQDRAHRRLNVLEAHVPGDRLDLERTPNAFDRDLATHGLRVDRALRRHGDLEVDAESLAAEEIEPPALLLVQVRLDVQLLAALLHPNLKVLQKPLRAVLAPGAHALARDDSDLACCARRGDRCLARNVADAQLRRALESEVSLDRIGVALAADITNEIADERARELAGVELAAVDRETVTP